MMKSQMFLAVLLALVLFSCTKSSNNDLVQNTLPKNYFYKVDDVDLNDSVMVSTPIFRISMEGQTDLGITLTDDGGNDDHDYCKKHPHDPKCQAVPVIFVSWSATWISHNKNITWAVATEANVKYYSIKRSIDGIVFKEMVRIAPNSVTGSYKWIDYSN